MLNMNIIMLLWGSHTDKSQYSSKGWHDDTIVILMMIININISNITAYTVSFFS